MKNLLSVGSLVFVLAFFGCNDAGPTKIVDSAPPPGSTPETCSGQPLGSTRAQSCPTGYDGQKLQVCTEDGWQVRSDTCAPIPGNCADKVTFQDVKPILTQKCVQCHASPERYDDYEVAKRLADENIYRINLPSADLKRMPRTPAPELSFDEKQLFEDWRNDGLVLDEDCPPGVGVQHLDLDHVENAILNDLNRLDGQGRLNSRYLLLTHKHDLGSNSQDLGLFRSGVNKTMNSLSTDDDIALATPIDREGSVYRIDLRAYNLTPADWQLVIDTDPIKFESFTVKGLTIKDLTQVARPWMHADNFTIIANDPDIYYTLMEVPLTRAEFFDFLDVDFQGDFDNFEVTMAGFFGSPISLNKNRLIARNETDDGYLWSTFDPDDIQTRERNLFEFPLLAETGGQANFVFDAQEMIWTLPNGLQGYALYDAAGNRANDAPVTVVTDTDSPFSPIIENALSCYRCHANGLIAAQDQVRDSVLRNASEFTTDDVELVKVFYKQNQGLAATFTSDIRLYNQALEAAGTSAGDPDPVNFLSDRIRKDLTLEEVASFLFLRLDEFRTCLNGSAVLKAEIGQLLSGGLVSFGQLITSFPNIVIDCRIGQDPIDQ